MEIERDFKELLVLVNSHHVEYLLVGAYALAFHGAPRFTGDLDIFINPDALNSKNIMAALKDFGFGGVGLSAQVGTEYSCPTALPFRVFPANPSSYSIRG